MAETKALSPIDEVRNTMEKMRPQFKKALPPQISPEKFERVAMTAIQNNPKLLEASRHSLYGACMKAAADGLIPDGKEAALVQFGSEVAYMPMVAGIMKKVRNSGELSSITANVVYEKDIFKYILGDSEAIVHEVPPLGMERGKAIGAYAVATLKDGMKIREVMSVQDIEKIRSVSRAKSSGPWVQWWDEMARKTVIRRLAKRLPSSTDLDVMVEREDELVDLNQKPSEPVSSEESAKPKKSRLDTVVDAQTVAVNEPNEDPNTDDLPL